MTTIPPGSTFEFAPPDAGRPAQYPWQTWSDGQTRIMTHGVHFTSDVAVFQNTVHHWARRHGLSSRTQRTGVDEHGRATVAVRIGEPLPN